MCNTALPDNAIAVTDVVPGMQIHAAYGGERGMVAKTLRMGQHVWITFTDGTRMRASAAGTFRLDNDENHRYHNGHGCIHDW
jgi:hypothetical protein